MCFPSASSPVVAEPAPVALLGAICFPLADSPDMPNADASLYRILNSFVSSEPAAEPLAVLGEMCRPIASSPAVAPPDAEAERRFL